MDFSFFSRGDFGRVSGQRCNIQRMIVPRCEKQHARNGDSVAGVFMFFLCMGLVGLAVFSFVRASSGPLCLWVIFVSERVYTPLCFVLALQPPRAPFPVEVVDARFFRVGGSHAD